MSDLNEKGKSNELDVRRLVDSILNERRNALKEDIKSLSAAVVADQLKDRYQESGLKAVIKKVIAENAPDIIKADTTSRRYALIFGGIALFSSVINIGATVWNGFDQSSTLKAQTQIITLQTLAERAGIAEQLGRAVSSIDQVKSQLNDVNEILTSRESIFYTYAGPAVGWSFNIEKFAPKYCDEKAKNPPDCRKSKVYDLIKSASFGDDPGGQIQLGATLQNMGENMSSMSVKINPGTNGTSTNLYGVLLSARDICRNPADAVTVSKGVNDTRADYKTILTVEGALELINKSALPVFDRYRIIRGDQVNSAIGDKNYDANMQDYQLKISVRELKNALSEKIEEDFDNQLSVRAFSGLIAEGFQKLQEELPAVIKDCKNADDQGIEAIGALKPSKDDWSKLTARP